MNVWKLVSFLMPRRTRAIQEKQREVVISLSENRKATDRLRKMVTDMREGRSSSRGGNRELRDG